MTCVSNKKIKKDEWIRDKQGFGGFIAQVSGRIPFYLEHDNRLVSLFLF